jgi:hypothetical protein
VSEAAREALKTEHKNMGVKEEKHMLPFIYDEVPSPVKNGSRQSLKSRINIGLMHKVKSSISQQRDARQAEY